MLVITTINRPKKPFSGRQLGKREIACLYVYVDEV